MTTPGMTHEKFQHHRRRGIAIRAVAALILGLTISVTTGVLCALRSGSTSPPMVTRGIYKASGEIDPDPQHLPVRGLGVRGIAHFETMETPGLRPGITNLQTDFVGEDMAFGWPLPALSYRVVRADKPPATFLLPRPIRMGKQVGRPTSWLVGGLSGLYPTPLGSRWYGVLGRHIPLTPRFVGLFTNAVIAGLPVYILIGGWADIRAFARARRGRCSRCGYDVRGLSRCPECGLETPRSLWCALRERLVPQRFHPSIVALVSHTHSSDQRQDGRSARAGVRA